MVHHGSEYHNHRRPIWLAAFLQIGIRVRYLWESWFGLRPLFLGASGYRSPFRPKNCPDYDWITKVGFMWTWFLVGISREPEGIAIPYVILCKTGLIHLVVSFHQWLCDRLEKQFKEAGFKGADREVPIPEFDWKKNTPDQFYEMFAVRPHPVILRGFMKDTALLKDLGWKAVLERFGEEDVLLTRRELDGYPGKLKEVNDNSVYLHNSEKLFNKYPELRDLFQYQRLEDYLKMKPGYEQLFVGRRGTGTPFHNAAVWNWFYMIDGTKKWWFVDPYDTFLTYPLAICGRAAGFFFCLWPGEYNVEAFPLFKYCPLYTAELQPGDVLFNPPWWWHAIKNTSETTVAVASRWHTDGICGHNLMMTEEDYECYRWGSMAFLLGLKSWGFLHSILQEPSPRFDEHSTLRETNNRFVHKQVKMNEVGGVNALGITVKF